MMTCDYILDVGEFANLVNEKLHHNNSTFIHIQLKFIIQAFGPPDLSDTINKSLPSGENFG